MKQYDVIVVGAGPAGLGAAIEAARGGAAVLLLDENNRPGGQLFKQIHKFFGSRDHYAGMRGYEIGQKLLAEAESLQVETRLDTRVWGIFPDGSITACTKDESFRCQGKYIILATGATENGLVFPGNTLPGVITAGAAQTMVNLRGVRPGKRAVVVGSGNVGLIVTYQLLQAGMDVAAIVEAAPKLSGYEVHAGKVRRAGVPILLSHTVIEAKGEQELSQVVIAQVDEKFQPIPGTEQTFDADTLCIAVGLTPRIELAAVADCQMDFCGPLGGRLPMHSKTMATKQPHILIAGDITGVEEASTALDEGRLAGVEAAGRLGLLSQETWDNEIATIQGRIDSLRQGIFGQRRQDCKAQIWDTYQTEGGHDHG